MTDFPGVFADNNAADLFKSFSEELSEAERYLESALSGMPSNLSDLSSHLCASKGKFLRAGLLIASAKCGEYERQRVLPLAAAVEILHLGSLVHDDIIDDADIRRGKESLQKKFGKSAAVFTGDYLFTIVFSLVSKYNRDRMEDISKAVQKICLGEILQNRYRYSYNISITRYFRIATGKTAALFALAMYAGGKEGGLDERACRALGRAGGYAGLMFQIVDDCLDFNLPGAVPDKTAFKDIAEGVASLPVLLALKSTPDLLNVLHGASNPAEIRNAARIIEDVGGLEQAHRIAVYYYEKAKKQLNIVPVCSGTQIVMHLLEKCVKRIK